MSANTLAKSKNQGDDARLRFARLRGRDGKALANALLNDALKLMHEGEFVRPAFPHELAPFDQNADSFVVIVRNGMMPGSIALDIRKRPVGFAAMCADAALQAAKQSDGVYWRVLVSPLAMLPDGALQ